MADLARVLDESGAILRGHFVLTSGRHSDVYFEKFRILEQPEVVTALSEGLADRFRHSDIDLVAGPTTGGIIIAFEVARLLRVKALYVESEGGKKKLRRGARIEPGSRVLVVDDVFTTGLSVREVIAVVEDAGGAVAGVGVLIDRSEAPLDFECAFHAAYRVQATSYDADDVPDWLAAIPISKPGTRT